MRLHIYTILPTIKSYEHLKMFYFFYFRCMNVCLCVCLCTMCVSDAHGRQKRVSGTSATGATGGVSGCVGTEY